MEGKRSDLLCENDKEYAILYVCMFHAEFSWENSEKNDESFLRSWARQFDAANKSAVVGTTS